LNEVFDDRKYDWLMQELSVLKRLELNSNDELKNYQNEKTKSENFDLKKETLNAEFRTVKTSFDRVMLDMLNVKYPFQVSATSQKNSTHAKLQEVNVDEKDSKHKYWIERCLSEAVFLNIIDNYSTASCLSKKFEIKLAEHKSLSEKISVSRHFWLKNTTSAKPDEYFVANRTKTKLNFQECPQAEQILDAFMHFCYDYTNKFLIVLDLKTIEKASGEYLLTDPVVFSKNTDRYGSSNLGPSGIELFMSKHSCNKICHKLPLSDCNYRPDSNDRNKTKK